MTSPFDDLIARVYLVLHTKHADDPENSGKADVRVNSLDIINTTHRERCLGSYHMHSMFDLCFVDSTYVSVNFGAPEGDIYTI